MDVYVKNEICMMSPDFRSMITSTVITRVVFPAAAVPDCSPQPLLGRPVAVADRRQVARGASEISNVNARRGVQQCGQAADAERASMKDEKVWIVGIEVDGRWRGAEGKVKT